jgi:hypothetical protein
MNMSEQSDNTVGGDLAGGNITKHYYHPNSLASEYLRELYQKCLDEKNSETIKFAEKLDYYNSTMTGDVLGLEGKLEAAGREDRLWYAKEAKEQYHKKLLKTATFSQATQEINIFLLSEVQSSYLLNVYPLICDDDNQTTVDHAVENLIVKSLLELLGINLLGFTSMDILGMLYFLTGNCHIKWTA